MTRTILGAIFLFYSSIADSSIIRFEFSGVINEVDFSTSDPFSGSVVVGTSFHGFYEFESESSTLPGESCEILSQCRWELLIPPNSFGITLGDSSIDVPNRYTIINTNDLSGSGDDWYAVSSGSGSFNIGDWSAALQLFFGDDTGSLISNPQDIFREPPDLTNISFTQMGIVRILNGCSGCDGSLFGTVTSIVVTPKTVAIDIKPGSTQNSINLRSQGVIPVAILSTNTADGDAIDFDATQVDALTVKFGPSGAFESHGQGHVEDVDGDGDPDMVLHFKTQETGIVCGSEDATLVGETIGGTQFTGSDTVRTVGCNGSTKGKGAMSWIFLVGLGVLGLWRRKG